MRQVLLAGVALLGSATASFAYQDCKSLYPTIAQLEDRLTCLQRNDDEIKAGLASLLNGKLVIQNIYGGNTYCLNGGGYGNPNGNAAVELEMTCDPIPNGQNLWTLVPSPK